MTKLRKTGELSGLPLDGEGPRHPIREFVMAKLRRVYPKKSDERGGGGQDDILVHALFQEG